MLSALLALCERNPPVTGKFHLQRASNAELCFDVFFDIRPNKLFTKQSSYADSKPHDAHAPSL